MNAFGSGSHDRPHVCLIHTAEKAALGKTAQGTWLGFGKDHTI